MTTREQLFSWCESIGAAVFEVPPDCKDPTGWRNSQKQQAPYRLGSWKCRHSKKRSDWEAASAEHPDCNFGVYAAGSGLIVIDIDPSAEDRNGNPAGFARALGAWAELCASWGLPPLQPHVRSRSGGGHVYVRVPPGTVMTGWVQPHLVTLEGFNKAVVETRVHGFVLLPSSRFGGAEYQFWPGGPAPIYDAPVQLIEACRPKAPTSAVAPFRAGTYEVTGFISYIQAAVNAGALAGRDEWRNLGMVCKVEWGDAGIGVWRHAHDGTVTAQVEAREWASYTAEHQPGHVTIKSILKWQDTFGFKCHVQKTTAGMFGTVLPAPDFTTLLAQSFVPPEVPTNPPLGPIGGLPLPRGYSEMMGRGAMIAELGRPIVEAWRATQTGQPATDAPAVPSDAPLPDINTAIAMLVGIAESDPKRFRAESCADLLAVLHRVNEPVHAAVCGRLRTAGCAVSDKHLVPARLRFEAAVERALRTGAGWVTLRDGTPDPGNSDNVCTFLRIANVDIRHNGWTNKDEINRPGQETWRPLADHDLDSLMTDAANSQFNFRPSDAMFKRTVRAVARETKVDPVLDRIMEHETKWDRQPRLDTWLHHACHTPDDAYHRAVARNVLGGLVKRARRPGCKHDEVMVLICDEDGFKSTLARMLALDDEWFNDSVNCEGGDQNVIPQLFGKTVIELAELNMSRREVTYWKSFISRQADDITLKYKVFSEKFARRNIFIATSNNSQPLLSDTGNRRFLPVHLSKAVDVAWIKANLEQLIGEAAALESAGEMFLIPRDVVSAARAIQEDAREIGSAEVFTREWFEHQPDDTYVTSGDLERALIATKTGRIQGTVREALRKIGFVKFNLRIEKEMTRGYIRSTHRRAAEWRKLIFMCLPNSGNVYFTPAPVSAADAPPLPPNVIPMRGVH